MRKFRCGKRKKCYGGGQEQSLLNCGALLITPCLTWLLHVSYPRIIFENKSEMIIAMY